MRRSTVILGIYSKFHVGLSRNVVSKRHLAQWNVNNVEKNFVKSPKFVPNFKPKETIDEKEVLRVIKLRNDADNFGTSSSVETIDLPLVDEGDIEEEKHARAISMRDLRPPISFYAKEIKKLLKQKKLREALEHFEVHMIQNDSVKPDDYLYNLLIGECGRVGYTHKAFEYYKKMKDRELKVSGSTITGLFNSCSNSPWPKNGLTNANYLRNDIKAKGMLLNDTNYHSMIKAFGKCGDLKTAFEIVDEMAEYKIPLTHHTFSNLLVACISNKEAGLLHAILVFRIMRQKKLIPNVFAYNLLLRAVLDCGIGNPEIAENQLLTPEKQYIAAGKINREKQIHSLTSKSDLEIGSSEKSQVAVVPKAPPTIPDLLNPYFEQGDIVALNDLTVPSRRLQLLGGVVGILSRMQRDSAKPDLKTFTQLLQIIPAKKTAESELLFAMEKHCVNPDITFFNTLIKKRNFNDRFKEAIGALTLISRNKLYPDLMTFGCLALGCHKWEDGKRLIADMRNAGFRPNVEIMGSLVKSACVERNFWYLIDMLKVMKEENIKPSPKFLENVERCRNGMKRDIVEQEKAREFGASPPGFAQFMKYYKRWLTDMNVDLPGHPWQSYEFKNVEDE